MELVHNISVESFVNRYCFFSFSVEGLHAIVVTDRDGVPVIKGKALSLNPSILIGMSGQIIHTHPLCHTILVCISTTTPHQRGNHTDPWWSCWVTRLRVIAVIVSVSL